MLKVKLNQPALSIRGMHRYYESMLYGESTYDYKRLYAHVYFSRLILLFTY